MNKTWKQFRYFLVFAGVLLLVLLARFACREVKADVYSPTDSIVLTVGCLDTTFLAISTPDSVWFLWWRDVGGQTIVDSAKVTTGLRTGLVRKKIKASDGSNNLGTYIAEAVVYKQTKTGIKTWTWNVKAEFDSITNAITNVNKANFKADVTNLDVAVSTRLAPAFAGRTLKVTSSGEGYTNYDSSGGTIANAQVDDDVDVNVKTMTDGVITAAKIADDAIDYATFASTAPTAWWNEGKTGYSLAGTQEITGLHIRATGNDTAFIAKGAGTGVGGIFQGGATQSGAHGLVAYATAGGSDGFFCQADYAATCAIQLSGLSGYGLGVSSKRDAFALWPNQNGGSGYYAMRLGVNLEESIGGSLSGSVGSVTGEVRINSIDTIAQVLNEVRVVSTDTLTTILGNVNGNVGGSVASVTGEVRVVSTDTIRADLIPADSTSLVNAEAYAKAGRDTINVHAPHGNNWASAGTATVDTASVARAVWDNDVVSQANRTVTASCFGSGARTVIIYVKSDEDSTGISGYQIDVEDSIGGETTYGITTNATGCCTLSLDSHTWTVSLTKTPYSITSPVYPIISSDTTLTYYATPSNIGSPLASDMCRIYCYSSNSDGSLLTGARLYVWIDDEYGVVYNYDSSLVLSRYSVVSVASGSNGLDSVSVYRCSGTYGISSSSGDTVKVWIELIGSDGRRIQKTKKAIPDQSSWRIQW